MRTVPTCGKNVKPGVGPGLQRVAHEVLIEVEQRREVGREERRADRVRPGRGLEAHAHRRAAAAAEERFGPCCPPSEAGAAPASGRGRRRPRRARLRRRAPPQFGVGAPNRPPPCQSISSQPLAVEQDFELLARAPTRSRSATCCRRRSASR